MPYLLKSLVGTRRDPNRRNRLDPAMRRAQSRLLVAGKHLKSPRPVLLSDAVYAANRDNIQRLADNGIIEVTRLGKAAPEVGAPVIIEAEAPPLEVVVIQEETPVTVEAASAEIIVKKTAAVQMKPAPRAAAPKRTAPKKSRGK
jgi:hypothetical protein